MAQGEFLQTVKKRAAAILEARGMSSAASASHAIVDSVASIVRPTPPGECVSLAVVSRGEYGVPEGLQFGFPVRTDAKKWEVVPYFSHSEFATRQIRERPTTARRRACRGLRASRQIAPLLHGAALPCGLPCRGSSGCAGPKAAKAGRGQLQAG